MRPEDRLAWHQQAQQERYEWAKSVDPEAVAQYEASVESRIIKAERISA